MKRIGKSSIKDVPIIYLKNKINKRGELTTKEIMEIVLGGAATLLLVVLLYNLIAPNFDKTEETAKSYFDSFEDAVAVADSGGTGSFEMWMPTRKDSKKYFLIYFGRGSRFGKAPDVYTSFGDNVNHVCVCYWEGLDVCRYCRNLNYPAVLVEGEEQWAITAGEKIEITKKGDYYEIVRED